MFSLVDLQTRHDGTVPSDGCKHHQLLQGSLTIASVIPLTTEAEQETLLSGIFPLRSDKE